MKLYTNPVRRRTKYIDITEWRSFYRKVNDTKFTEDNKYIIQNE